MNSLDTLGRNTMGIKNFFKNIEGSIRQEQKEMFFEEENDKEKAEYFDFLKFLFSNPSKA